MNIFRRAALLILALLLPAMAGAQALFLVFSAHESAVKLLDAERRQWQARIELPQAPQGAPQFSPDGRHAFVALQEGWIAKIDLHAQQVAATARVGTALRGMALSRDGRWLLAGNAQPPTAVLLDEALQPVKTLALQTLDGRQATGAAAVRDAPQRRSFVLALQGVTELWEISYDPQAAPIYDGLVHDYQMGEAIAKPGFHTPRRTPLAQPLGDFTVVDHAYVVGITPTAEGGRTPASVINLDVRRAIATLPIDGTPHPGGAAVFQRQGTPALALPNRSENSVSLIDTKTWKLLAQVPTPGPVRELVAQPGTQTLWAAPDAAGEGAFLAIDPSRAAVIATIPGPPGPVAFSADGRTLLIGAPDAVLAYDAETRQLIQRLPVAQPVGIDRVPAPPAR